MKAQKKGKIVNIGSASMLLGKTDYLHYVTSKSALVGMTRAMAKELGKWDITVNLVMPGATFTEIERETVTEQQTQMMVNNMSLGRKQVPQDLVGPVLFFSSTDSDFVTGQSLCVDGGINFL
jgi:3-oxoacyl-[acyl-carrier protein] reductase